MIEQEEMDIFYEQGDKLLDGYEKYIEKIKDLDIENPEIKQVINNLIEVMGNNMIMLSRIMDETAELKEDIMAEVDHPSLQSIDAIRNIKALIKKNQQEYLIRISNDAKLKQTLFYVLDRYEDYENAVKEAGLSVEKIGPKERKEKKEENKEDSKEDIIKKLAENIEEYNSIKQDKDITKKGLRLGLIKKEIKKLGDVPWIKKEFEKHTGDIL